MRKNQKINRSPACKVRITAIKDTMEILSGKWKFHILGTLLEGGKMRFMDLLRELDGIAAKMLSKELQDMEMNHLVSRTVLNTKPITVEYEVTEYGRTVEPIINEIAKWGSAYRNALYKDAKENTIEI
ncbi:MAG: helix-turn-helix domain-containing protein [Bacteroidota bacterium]